jgi:hypothetical protein
LCNVDCYEGSCFLVRLVSFCGHVLHLATCHIYAPPHRNIARGALPSTWASDKGRLHLQKERYNVFSVSLDDFKAFVMQHYPCTFFKSADCHGALMDVHWRRWAHAKLEKRNCLLGRSNTRSPIQGRDFNGI